MPATEVLPPETRPCANWRVACENENCSRELPRAKRASAPVSQSSQSKEPRNATFKPQPIAGVAYWLLAGVATERSAETDADELNRSLERNHPCKRQPSSSCCSGWARVRLVLRPLASEAVSPNPE